MRAGDNEFTSILHPVVLPYKVYDDDVESPTPKQSTVMVDPDASAIVGATRIVVLNPQYINAAVVDCHDPIFDPASAF